MSKAKINHHEQREIPFTVHHYEIEGRTYRYKYSIVIIGRYQYFVMNHTTDQEWFIDKRTIESDAWKYHESLGKVIAHHMTTVKEERDS